MSEKQQIRLSLSESKGAFPGGPRPVSDGGTVHTVPWGSICPGCDRIPAAGQQITKIFHAWWHASCGASYLRSTAADEAWLALAHQLERSPSKFNNAETKAITHNLLRIAGRSFTIPEHGHNNRVHGSRAVLAAVPDADAQFADVVSGFDESDLYAAVMQSEQRHPGEQPVVVGARAWELLNDEQRETHLPELLHSYVELVRIQRDGGQQ
ncbi:hypothetical protein KQY30_24800 [Streptomyces sp. GMY02]|uniref:hypothetical protein n=1 Tax=Streptomyces sp. GMY02 TaxID=1333528 RepID=UPI001C2CA933|nr:hypothetical protein [Streptomyces sp. GMY02]QXE36947.1 hypothetical protein KQY30_24800 [Streptomyces sp. GMY02]